MKEQLEVLEMKNRVLRKKLEQKPTSLKKLEKLLIERMDDMNEDWNFFQEKKLNGERLRNCVNNHWKEYPIRIEEIKEVIKLINN